LATGAFTVFGYVREYPLPVVIAGGSISGALFVAAFWTKSVPRGMVGIDLRRQSRFIDGSSTWADEEDENGKVAKVRRGEKATLGLPLKGKAVADKMGLVISTSEKIQTTYDLIFGTERFNARSALGRNIKSHTFKDKTLRDGTPNPKPTVIDVPGVWGHLTYEQMKNQARAFGTCLRKVHGISQKEKIAIWAGNCVEWMLADMSCAVFNWTSVSVYDTIGPNAASYIVADSGAKVLVCENKCLKKSFDLLEDENYINNKGAALKIIVNIGEGVESTVEAFGARGVVVLGFDSIIHQHATALEPDTPPTKGDIATLMYTSGTTGMPKGVKLAHANLVSTISMIELTPSISLSQSDVHLSYLPLAHIFERQNCLALLANGAVVYFASQGSKGLLPDLSVVRPTVFAGVPKVYENVRDAVKRKMVGIKKTMFEQALRAKCADLATGCGYSPIWDMLIFSKTKSALGGRVRVCITGGAPISKDTLQFVICALGPVVQGYGATETSSASTLSMSFDLTVGPVGPPIGTVAIRLADVPDMNYFSGPQEVYKDEEVLASFRSRKAKNGGEVWIGGPGVSPGYYDPSVDGLVEGLPSNGMTKKTHEEFFREDGWSWFKTGDIGTWTELGSLKIVDRRKNMFKTALGEYVPVEEVEKTYQDAAEFADFVFIPKETKVAYIALCVVVSDSIGGVMRWAEGKGVQGDTKAVVASNEFKTHLFDVFEAAAKAAKLQRFMWVAKKNIHIELQPVGYQDDWVNGVEVANGHTEQLLTATFKARRAQLDQYFAPVFPKIYPDRPADHILP